MMRRTVAGAATLICVGLAWYLLTTVFGAISPGRFPSPPEVWQAGRQALTTGYADATLLVHALHSLRLVVLGFLKGTAGPNNYGPDPLQG